MTDDQQTPIIRQLKHQSSVPFASGVSLNRKLAIAISVPICIFVLLAVVAVAVYCSRLHRPHRKETDRRDSEDQHDSALPGPASSDDQHEAAVEGNESQPDIKAILDALHQPKRLNEADSVPTATEYNELEQVDQHTKRSAEFSPGKDNSSDDEGTHFSDIEDPFVDHEESPDSIKAVTQALSTAEQDTPKDQGVENSKWLKEASSELGTSELEDPFVDPTEVTLDLKKEAMEGANDPEETSFAGNAGLWLKSSRRIAQADPVEKSEESAVDKAETSLKPSGGALIGKEDDQALDMAKETSLEQAEEAVQTAHSADLKDPVPIIRKSSSPTPQETAPTSNQLPTQDDQADHIEDDDLLTHIQAVEEPKRDEIADSVHSRSSSIVGRELGDVSQSVELNDEQGSQEQETLLGTDLQTTARSRSFGGSGTDTAAWLRRSASR